MSPEKRHPQVELTREERMILRTFAEGNRQVLVVKDDGGNTIGARWDDGQVVDLETVRRLNRRGWLSFRRVRGGPSRYVLNTRGKRAIENHLG